MLNTLSCLDSDGEDLLRPRLLDLPGPSAPPGAQWRHCRCASWLAKPQSWLAPPADFLPVSPGHQPQYWLEESLVHSRQAGHMLMSACLLRGFVLRHRCFKKNGLAAGADGTHPKCCLRCNIRHNWRHQTGMCFLIHGGRLEIVLEMPVCWCHIPQTILQQVGKSHS